MVTYIGFSIGKGGFPESFVACDLKGCPYRQLIELINPCEFSRSMSLLDLGQRSFTIKIKLNFLTIMFLD